MSKYDGAPISNSLFVDKQLTQEELVTSKAEFKSSCHTHNQQLRVQRRSALNRVLTMHGHKPVDPNVGITMLHRRLYKLYTKKEYRG